MRPWVQNLLDNLPIGNYRDNWNPSYKTVVMLTHESPSGVGFITRKPSTS
jgi:hypothetical protein